ncbi:MAG TPA: glycosyltransferase family 4 protein [Gaiellaceae bacterium]|nr:glycosyltransferase family 4 protein [Gaiellaceae bacterium]
MRVLFFGTYDADTITRVRVLQEGLAALGDEVTECNVALGLDTASRVRILQRPWLAPVLVYRIASAWVRLLARARRAGPVDAVVVGYMGHFDVHLARRRWRRTPIVLDHLVSGADTALDRRSRSARLQRALRALDRAALGAADLACVDTEEHLELVPPDLRERAVVARVGAPERWFRAPPAAPSPGPLRVVFYGSFTPLHGAPVIGEAIGLLAREQATVRFTLIGRGQDYELTRAAAGRAATVTWIDWIAPAELPAVVSDHDVCLGIFGTTPKAARVVPMKVFGGAAAGCVVVTSDTAPQRRALGEAGLFVPPGNPAALADVLRRLAADPAGTHERRRAVYRRAEEAFRPEVAVGELRRRLLALARA